MRGVVWVVLLFAVAVVAATTLGANDGLVSIYWSGWRTDLSLNLFLLALLALALVGMAVVHALGRVVSLPRRAGEWRALRRERAAEAALREAMTAYHAARYSRARKAAARALALQLQTPQLAASREFHALARLLAASSLHRLQDRTGRDEQLAAALGGPPAAPADGRAAGTHADAPGAPVGDPVAVAAGALPPAAADSGPALRSFRGGWDRAVDEGAQLLAAEWALEDRDGLRALEALGALAPGAARRTQALRLKLQAQRLARRPLEALHTARLLSNHQAFSPVVALGLSRSLAAEALDGSHDLQQLRRVWSQFEAAERRDPQVVVRAAARAVRLLAPDEARQWLRPLWERAGELDRADRDAVALGLLDARAGIGSDWLPMLESALQASGHEAAVQAAVGASFAECGLWGKARRLLEQAASNSGLPGHARRVAWRELARLARQEGDATRAADCDRAAAAID